MISIKQKSKQINSLITVQFSKRYIESQTTFGWKAPLKVIQVS